jgi:hypothetical protein
MSVAAVINFGSNTTLDTIKSVSDDEVYWDRNSFSFSGYDKDWEYEDTYMDLHYGYSCFYAVCSETGPYAVGGNEDASSSTDTAKSTFRSFVFRVPYSGRYTISFKWDYKGEISQSSVNPTYVKLFGLIVKKVGSSNSWVNNGYVEYKITSKGIVTGSPLKTTNVELSSSSLYQIIVGFELKITGDGNKNTGNGHWTISTSRGEEMMDFYDDETTASNNYYLHRWLAIKYAKVVYNPETVWQPDPCSYVRPGNPC